MTADNPMIILLAAPLAPDWTIDRLAEDILRAIAESSDKTREFAFDRSTTTDRQSRRLLRPLLACFAIKSAAEARISPDVYGGRLAFERPGHGESVWILGEFENTPNVVCIAFRRVTSPFHLSNPTVRFTEKLSRSEEVQERGAK